MDEVEAALVEFRDLAVSYGPVPALQGVSGPPETTPSGDGHVAFISYHLSGGTNDEHNRAVNKYQRGQ